MKKLIWNFDTIPLARPESMFLALVLASLLYYLVLVGYRLFLHPLSKFPGPRLAAATRLYDFYYSVVRDGMYTWEIERMHKQYGPIVRITPDEIHINDATFYNAIYTGGANKREKYHTYVKGIALPYSVVSTLDHSHHGLRRKFVSNFFSKRSVTGIEPLIQGKIEQLVQRLERCRETGSLANLNLLFHAMTIDVISHYAFGENYGFLDTESLEKEVRESLIALTLMFHLNRFLPFDATFMQKIPIGILKKIFPDAARFLTAKNRIRTQAIQTIEDQKKPSDSRSKGDTIFTALLSNELPASGRTPDRLQDEGMFLLQAGSETTGQALGVTMFYVLRNKAILARMQEELKPLMPDPSTHPTMVELQALPYFSAVINEGFRLSFGTLTRLPRIAPDEALQYKSWIIPPGTPVSQSTYLIHTDPKLFPDPQSFNPDRWIEAGDQRAHLESMLVNFTKGRRQCLGINLASTEIYLTVAHLVRWVDMELANDDLSVIQPYRDRLVIIPEPGDYKVEVPVKNVQGV